ncbi:tryptophan aminotransferase-related protein 2-like [Rutidosis leptorrhynchoides]|uniref:tryptophan aminotransferase-related protein 2-like n=1 Tax=Rutidosis leptorrhynchoides TaxID=125765 RepID=UPI003A993A12
MADYVFLLKNILVVSLAVNMCLILKISYYFDDDVETLTSKRGSHMNHELYLNGDKNNCFNGVNQKNNRRAEVDAHVSKTTTTKVLPKTTSSSPAAPDDGEGVVINLDHGDPTMYENFWKQKGEETTVVTSSWQYISYFSDLKNVCWFLEPELVSSITRIHKVVGNAITEGRHIVVGTGSSQLYQAALFALSPSDAPGPMSVVSAAPFYSSYPLMTDYLKSGLHKWAGDGSDLNKEEPYIELVTSPNNPDGFTRQDVVKGNKGILIHDLAYYWPQYTPISSPADNDIMLFTVSKSTGHAGTRIGWALVKDRAIAKKMTTFIEINTIGVSKESQIRAAKILQAVSDSCEQANEKEAESFFNYSYRIMEERWKKIREAVNKTHLFSLPNFTQETCSFSGRTFGQLPAFAWLKCEGEVDDCESLLRKHKIWTRGGKHFGASTKYVRISMLSQDIEFEILTRRLPKIIS